MKLAAAQARQVFSIERRLSLLGHIVSAKGVAANPMKVKAIQNYPVPTNLRKLRSFLGLASYYRRFIAKFSASANPLFKLTHKDTPFEWCAACHEAFVELKRLLTNAPLLVFPDFSKPSLLETNTSGEGLGAVLAQGQEDDSVNPCNCIC